MTTVFNDNLSFSIFLFSPPSIHSPLLCTLFYLSLPSPSPPPRVHQERLAPWVSAATLDPQVHLESRDFLVPQGRRAPRETLDHLEAPVKTDPRD